MATLTRLTDLHLDHVPRDEHDRVYHAIAARCAETDAHPECQVTVLCGHTHSSGEAQIRPNLHVRTGGARYGEPAVQDVITVGGNAGR